MQNYVGTWFNIYNNEDIDKLCKAADELRKYYCGNKFDICTIINGKSGRCSENCKFCAQSSHYETLAEEYPLLETEEVLVEGKISEGEEEFFKLIFWFAPQFWQNSAPFLTSVPHLEQNISIPSQKNIHIFLFLFYHRSFYLSIKTK